jgi:hypothetical protein
MLQERGKSMAQAARKVTVKDANAKLALRQPVIRKTRRLRRHLR